MKTKYEDMAGHQAFLMVPVLDERVRDIPLDTQDMLVYGFLVFQAKGEKKRTTSRTTLAITLRLDKKATDRSVDRLVTAGLAGIVEGQVMACEPSGATREWFRFRKKAAGDWQEHFVYDRVYLARSSETLSVKTNILFWHLVKIGFPLENMPGYLQAGGDKKARWLTNEYLARAIRCSPRTVGRGLKRLAEFQLISIQKVGRHNFVVGIRPLARNASLWRKEWKAVIADNGPVTAQSLFGLPSSAELIPDLPEDLAITKYLRAFRVSGKVAQECVTKILKYQVDEQAWKDLLNNAVTVHGRNRASDPKAYPTTNCGFLFKHMLEERIKEDSERGQRREISRIQGYEEMKALELVGDYRLVPNAEVLIREAVREECLPLRDGQVVPCRIHWDVVLACAKKAGKDWKVFQRLFAEQIFDFSGGPPASDWYDRWMAVEQIPTVDSSPMKILGLDSKAMRSVRAHAEIIAKGIYDDDDKVRYGHLVNNLIRLGCWQARSNSVAEVEGTMNAIKRVLTRTTVNDSVNCRNDPFPGDAYLTESEEMSLVG